MKGKSTEQIGEELIAFMESEIMDEGMKVGYDTPFSELGISSLSIIEIVLFIERRFGFSLPEADLVPENLKSVRAISENVARHINS